MANFDLSIDVIMEHEGYGQFTNTKNDLGGPTKYGITQATLSEFFGHPATIEEVQYMEYPTAKSIYYREYWMPIHGNDIIDQNIATKCFDICVNTGVFEGTKIIQESINLLAKDHIAVDGSFGPDTLKHLNSLDPNELLSKLKETQKNFYLYIVSVNPTQKEFLRDWLVRSEWPSDPTNGQVKEA